MIVVSLLLILVAVALLAIGLAGGSSPLLISSIVASLLAAVALVIGARRAAAQRRRQLDPEPDAAQSGYPDAEPAVAYPVAEPAAAYPDADDAADRDFDGRLVGQAAGMEAHAAGRHDADAALASGPTADRPAAHEGTPTDPPGLSGDVPVTSEVADPDEDDPADEPPPQTVRPSDAVRVARMDDEVLVVDSRPRYHVGDCPHLAGRRTEPLPIHEAVELGFSPCGQCRPVDRLVARAARR